MTSTTNAQEINSITFGIYSETDILNMSVCSINNPRKSGIGTVYDPRLGTIDSSEECQTCKQDAASCPGHFGHIELNEPVVHPLFTKRVVHFLNCICMKCNRLLIGKDQINLIGINKYKGQRKFTAIVEKLKKIDICCQPTGKKDSNGDEIFCGKDHPTVKFNNSDNSFSIIYENNKKNSKQKTSVILSVEEIVKIFDNIPDSDVELMGFNPELVHPRNFVITVLPVCPPCFMKDTIVFTNNGYKYIQDVLPNDKLYTHTGEFMKISKTYITPYYSQNIIEINTVYRPHTIKCTPKHPFYTREITTKRGSYGKKIKTIKEPKWTDASNLTLNDYIGMVRNTKSIIPEFNIEKKGKTINIVLNNLLQWVLFGYFTGDGWLDFNRKGRFFLCFHIKDEEIILDLLKKLNITFSYKCHGNSDKCKTLECHDYIYWHILKTFGHLAHNKMVPIWVHDSPSIYIEEYLKGYCLADGHIHKRNKIQFVTVSKDLALSVQLLYLKLGKIAGINYGKGGSSVIDGRQIKGKNKYTVEVVENRKYDLNIYYIEDDWIWFKISSIKNITSLEDTLVYNFEVDNDHTYCVNNLITHNCDRPFVKADGKTCDDDLTIQYMEIIKANNNLSRDETLDSYKKKKRKEQTEQDKAKARASLRFRILTTFNNSQGKAKHTTNNRAIKSIKDRLTGKDGQIRMNVQGKRSVTRETVVWLWDGKMKTADEIQVGDIVIGDDGEPRNVIDTVQGKSLIYKIKQNDGYDYRVSDEHILTLKYCGHCEIYWQKTQGKYGGYQMNWFDRETNNIKSVKVSVKPSLSVLDAKMDLQEFMEENGLEDKKISWNPKRKRDGTWRINWSEDGKKKSKEIAVVVGKTKEEAYEELDDFRNNIDTNPNIDIHVKDFLNLAPSHQRKMLGIKLSTPIKWSKQDVKLNPYILGMWLGDGGTPRATFTNPDEELVEYFRNWAEENGGYLHTNKDNLHHGVSGCDFLNKLRSINVFNNKHIPEEYIINDVETRLRVLAGLIDTDGSVEGDGARARITQCLDHEKIIEGAQRIAVSLGFRTSVITRKTSWRHKGELKHTEALVLNISGNISIIPTLVPRKKCRDSKKDMSCTKIEVVEDGVDDFFGFEVDGNKHFILGKDATITHNCDQTGRTVIGPDPTLKMGELGVPREIASTLSVPVCVTNFNFHKLQEMVNTGLIKTIVKKDEKTIIDLKRYRRGTRLMHGDILYRGDEEIKIENTKELVQDGDRVKRNGEFLTKLKSSNRDYTLEFGFTVNRPLQNGDYVLLNRQPTLHKASMMAMQIIIKDNKTFTMNLAITKPFNADFDGDEMNIHVPQSLEAQAELKYLSYSHFNIISAQSSKPNMAIVQDSLLGAYKMTKGNYKLTKSQFFNIAMKLPQSSLSKYPKTDDGMMSPKEINDKIQHIRRVLKEKGKKVQCFNGKGIISLFLPDDLIYNKVNNKDDDEPEVKIYRGVMYEGVFDKNIIGSSHNALHQTIHKEYGSEESTHFIDCIQFSTNNYLLIDGFSVGLGDCLMSQDSDNLGISKKEQIRDAIKKCYVEAEGIKQTTHREEICEVRINAALNKAKDIGLKIAKDALSKTNNFLNTVHSGSKGDFFNIAQITGLLGQQNLKGKRVPLLLNNGKRSLPHYPFGEMEPEMEYESRGFIDRGFLNGLNPRQFYFHAMSGREGICDKLVSQTGGCLIC